MKFFLSFFNNLFYDATCSRILDFVNVVSVLILNSIVLTLGIFPGKEFLMKKKHFDLSPFLSVCHACNVCVVSQVNRIFVKKKFVDVHEFSFKIFAIFIIF